MPNSLLKAQFELSLFAVIATLIESFELQPLLLPATFAIVVAITFILVLLLDFIELRFVFAYVPNLFTFTPRQGSDLPSPYSQG